MSTRLPGKAYKAVFDQGRSARGRFVVAWQMKCANADRMAGVVVSKRIFHDAVDRNRAKRLMREAFRLLVKEEAIDRETWWVFVARGAIINVKCAEVMKDIKKICARF